MYVYNSLLQIFLQRITSTTLIIIIIYFYNNKLKAITINSVFLIHIKFNFNIIYFLFYKFREYSFFYIITSEYEILNIHYV